MAGSLKEKSRLLNQPLMDADFFSEACLPHFFICASRLYDNKKLTNYIHGQYADHAKAITYTAARESLASTMDQVCSDREPVIITRKRDQAVVMLSLEYYDALEETAHLLRSPANAKRLIASIEAAEKGDVEKREIALNE